MPAWIWVIIALAVVAVIAVVAWQALVRKRTGRLQDRFGPEYDRMVGTAESKRDAEAELEAREERRRQLDIHPLSYAARDRYLQNWKIAQAQFVDDPATAVASGDSLIRSVMAERGYPVEDFEQRAADISVDHPQVVDNYRQAHRLAVASARGSVPTEDLRRAMQHFRALFEELVEPAADQPIAREQPGGKRVAEPDRGPVR